MKTHRIAESAGGLSAQGRRAFFHDLLGKVVEGVDSAREEIRGRPQMKMTELTEFSDPVLRRLTPVFNSRIWHDLQGTTLRLRLHDADDPAGLETMLLTALDAQILEQFGRGFSLQQVAANLEARPAWPSGCSAYPFVKTLFLTLARGGVCHPAESADHIGAGD